MTAKARAKIPLWLILLLAVGTPVAAALLYVGVFYKQYYVPSEAMAPTLLEGDRFMATRWLRDEPKRGDVILLRVGRNVYIKRVAGLPGDRVEMAGGILILNGRPVPQQLVRTEPGEEPWEPVAKRRLREQFPGEARPHEIYDLGPSPADDIPEQVVQPGHYFVLGDNRDRSADSRVPRAEMGVEQLPAADVVGKAVRYTWGPSGRFGERIGG